MASQREKLFSAFPPRKRMTQRLELVEQPNVTLEWPEGGAFALSYERIQVYDLKLSNGNGTPLAVKATTEAPGCLIRPKQFLVPGKGQAYLTMVFMPGALFTEEDLQRSDKSLRVKTALQTCFKYARQSRSRITFLSFSFSPFEAKTKEAATKRATQTLDNGLNVSPMHFHCTSPGYVTAYIYLSYSSASHSENHAPNERSIYWRLTPQTPFWYSLPNAFKLGTHASEGTQHDAYTLGYLSPGSAVFTYIDLKAYGGERLQGGRFKGGGEQVFVLEAEDNQNYSARVTIELPHDLSEDLIKELSGMGPPKSLHLPSSDFSFVFSAPNNKPQSASLTLANESPTHILVYRLQAQEPSFFKFPVSFGKLLTIAPKQSATLTVELNLGVKLTGNHLFRLDTFLYYEQDGEKCSEWTMERWIKKMMRSMEARQMESIFIPCKFKEERKPSSELSSKQSSESSSKTSPKLRRKLSPKPSPKPSPRPFPKLSPKPSSKSSSKPSSKPNSKPSSKPSPKPGSKPSPRPIPRPSSNVRHKPTHKPSSKPRTKRSPKWSDGTSDLHAEFNIRPTGQITGLPALGFPLPMLPGDMMDQSPSANTPDFTDFLAHLGVQNGQQITSPGHSPATQPSFDLLSGAPITPHTGLMAPFPGATPPDGQPASSSLATPVDAESGLHRWRKKPPESPPKAATLETTSNKPSTGSADKQMAIVDKQSPTGTPTMRPPSTVSTVKSLSGTENSPQRSPGTPPSNPTIITERTRSKAPSTAVPGNILPQTISSVCRQRKAPFQAKKKGEPPKDSKKKENEKKTVSPMRNFTPKPASPGAARPRTVKSKLLAPSRATRPHSRQRLPCSRAPFAPVGDPKPEDMVALLQIIVSLAIYLILFNALITALE